MLEIISSSPSSIAPLWVPAFTNVKISSSVISNIWSFTSILNIFITNREIWIKSEIIGFIAILNVFNGIIAAFEISYTFTLAISLGIISANIKIIIEKTKNTK